MKYILFVFSLVQAPGLHALEYKSTETIYLNVPWEIGYDRIYTDTVQVPGIHTDPSKMCPSTLWYRNEISLPAGNWNHATLELKGARFSPEVFINGISVSKQNGGMAPTFHLLKHKDVQPGNKIIIEIALKSLKDIPSTDASYIPVADQWRSNISSSLWNDVILKLHGDIRIDRIIPFINFNEQQVDFSVYLTSFKSLKNESVKGRIEILDDSGNLVLFKETQISSPKSKITLKYGDLLKAWSPEHPNLYKVKLSLIDNNDTIDQLIIPFGVKDFRVDDKQFYLNNVHITLLGGTVVWHRWVRDPEAKDLAYNTDWFTQNVITQLKEHGANYLRFHLGVPPESFLDLCDKYGLLVQYEWSFFHGMPAGRESLLEQFPNWIDMAMRHPSVVLFHPYNETEGDQLEVVWSALNEIIKQYPPLVMEERDVLHIHKYWWSLFENLGLYYNSANQFPKAIMVDEFGGNYLDGKGEMGAYKTVPETFLRFLGRNHTTESRLKLHTQANAKVAEYWRRTGVAGVAPFCILGSQEDGSHWFMGNLEEGKPKPVWDALTCAWSPRSVSLEIWDRNFSPGQKISLPVYLFNDTQFKSNFNIRINLNDCNGKIISEHLLHFKDIPSFTTQIEKYELDLPFETGNYILSAELINRPETVKYPVISNWGIHIFKPEVPGILAQSNISVAADEPEIIQFLKNWDIKIVPLDDPSSKIILLSEKGWKRIANRDGELLKRMEQAIDKGTSVILLDAGERYLGQGYPSDKSDLGPLQGVVTKSNTPVKTYDLFGGINLSFSEAAEPESHIHPDKNNSVLWNNVPLDYTWLWNGMRGGLIVPATNFECNGLNQSAFLAQWLSRGADTTKIKKGNYFAYEMEGFYEFSDSPNDNGMKEKLKNKLAFLIEDAPALANALNPFASVKITDVSKTYRESQNGQVEDLEPLVNAGKNLTRTPAIIITFGEGKGKLIVSQLLTSGRLVNGSGEEGLYGIRYDGVANQFVLNMMEAVLKNN